MGGGEHGSMSRIEAPLATAPTPSEPLKGAARRAAMRRNWIDAIPASAYETPVHVMPSWFGPMFLVSDLEGVRRVLLDAVEDYPKHAIHLTVTRLVFGDGLLSSEGETWRAHRRILSPAFEPRTVATHAPAIVAAAERLARGWDHLARGAEVDIADEMLGLALHVVSSALFSSDSDAVTDSAGRAMRTALSIRPNLLDLLPVIGRVRRGANERRVAAVFGELDAHVHRLIGEREAAGDDAPRDLLTRLVTCRDAEGGGRLTVREVRDEAVTMFLAGHETTAVAMTWIWYVLSQRPEAEARLHAELDAELGGRAPDAPDLPRLVFTRALVQEVMRLYPPVPNLLARRAAKRDVIAGVTIPRGAMVGVTPWIVHRHRRLWDEPDRFDPERFLGEAGGARPRLAYIPFGAGPRTCIGAQLAMSEIMLVLASVAQRYRLRLAPGQTVELQHRVTLRPVGGMRMRLERR
jgi:cytochrome P450